jgi:hypothetical protein
VAAQKILRMQELRDPWTHFFRNNRPDGQGLIADYQSAHLVGEAYAGIPGNLIPASDPARLEDIVRAEGFAAQPNEFPTNNIRNALQNAPNTTPAAWLNIYANVLNGTTIPVPYSRAKVADPVMLTAAATAYRNVMAGTAPLAGLPDIRHIFTPEAERDTSLAPAAGLNGQQLLVQMCQRCHNSSLDQTISRARFNVATLAAMSREEKDLAITRLKLPSDNRLKMPPARFGHFSQAELDLAIQALTQ